MQRRRPPRHRRVIHRGRARSRMPMDKGPLNRSATLDAVRALIAAMLALAWPASAAVLEAAQATAPPDAELLEFLGESAGIDPELALFMETREARKAIKDAKKEDRHADRKEENSGTLDPAARWSSMNEADRTLARERFQRWRELSPAERDKLRERWEKFRELTPEQQEALREAYRHYLSLPPAQRDATSKRWEQMSPEEQRRAISRRQGSKPGTYDKRPCPPC